MCVYLFTDIFLFMIYSIIFYTLVNRFFSYIINFAQKDIYHDS
jgi:hypothetical protein